MLPAIFLSLVLAQLGAPPSSSSDSAPCPQDTEASVATLVQPGGAELADDTKFTGTVTGEVQVHVLPNGAIAGATIYKSTGNMHLDQALLWGSRRSTYAPKIVNCRPVDGIYLYRMDFARYRGDMAKTTARFTAFFNSVLATTMPPPDPSVQLDPNITTAQSLHVASTYYSTLGAFRELRFLGDDMVQGLHRIHYTAVFGGGKTVVMFVLDRNENIVGFVNED